MIVDCDPSLAPMNSDPRRNRRGRLNVEIVEMKHHDSRLKRFSERLVRQIRDFISNIYVLVAVGSLALALIFLFDSAGVFSWILLGLLFLGSFSVLEDGFELNRRLSALSGYRYRVEGRQLLQLDMDDYPMARIDLDEDFEVDIPHRGNGVGVVRVRQGMEIFEMPSSADGAEAIARTTLGITRWPPDAPWNFGY